MKEAEEKIALVHLHQVLEVITGDIAPPQGGVHLPEEGVTVTGVHHRQGGEITETAIDQGHQVSLLYQQRAQEKFLCKMVPKSYLHGKILSFWKKL